MKVKINNKIFEIKDCKGFRSMRGLMFDSLKKRDGALIYANNIWMPFVKHDLDLFFLDKNFCIIEKQRAVPLRWKRKTWKIYKNAEAKYCLEIKAGLTSPRNGTKVKV
jgi:uncharacterized membrane protein (UPF0127 family)